MSKIPQVKNRAAAAIQITAEQLLRIANNQGIEVQEKAPTQFITDKEELAQYQQTKRKDFEDQLRRSSHHIGIWCKYALWEASQKEFERARSVFERALDIDYRNQTLWQKYADMEMKNKFVNHARNVWDRAVTLHPRVDSFWYKYSYMEEMAGACDNARSVFERWMGWEPDDMSWASFINFEMRQGQLSRARDIYERYVALLPTCRAYLKYARWEERLHQRALARRVYERALEELHPTERTEKLLVNFARFEERCKEVDRARVIYQYALTQLAEEEGAAGAEEEVSELKREFVAFEKRHGSRDNIEGAIVAQRREHYNKAVAADVYDFDSWFDFVRLEEAECLAIVGGGGGGGSGSEEALETVRTVYNRAVACVPPVQEKRFWRRYVYLWINYAIFEELVAKDMPRTREVYRACLTLLPHRLFTFGKVWLMAAHLEVRQRDLGAARRLLGQAIGMCGKENIFRGYIELEHQMGEIDRCRAIYGKYIAAMPHNCAAWRNFAALEAAVGETQRARAIFDLAVGSEELDMPEVLWRAYIDWEVGEAEYLRARALHLRLVERSGGHVKTWVAYAQFLAEYGAYVRDVESTEQAGGDVAAARAVFLQGYTQLKTDGLKEERLLLLEAWRDAESEALQGAGAGGDRAHLKEVEGRFPKKIKMRRPVLAADGVTPLGSEEYFDYVFPDDEQKMVGMKFLEKAMAWKKAANAPAPEDDAAGGAPGSPGTPQSPQSAGTASASVSGSASPSEGEEGEEGEEGDMEEMQRQMQGGEGDIDIDEDEAGTGMAVEAVEAGAKQPSSLGKRKKGK